MFLQDVPLSALLLCYGPLLLTVGGFILFAAATDANARRTYLRRKPGSENGANAITRTINVETPAGVPLTLRPAPALAASAPVALLTAEPSVAELQDAAEAPDTEAPSAPDTNSEQDAS